jgi:1,4-dihydroxy-2-naphthoyl-CoA hydrolase
LTAGGYNFFLLKLVKLSSTITNFLYLLQKIYCMMLFPEDISVATLNATSHGTLISHLNIEYTLIAKDVLCARMPVDHRAKQPMGILHGGASVVLAETVGSMAANLMVDRNKYYCVGLEINANHVRKASEGYVYAEAKPLHVGKTTHVWQIHITDEDGQLICTSRHTVAVIEK